MTELRTHCKYGHEFTEENIYWYLGVRRCRKCNADKQRKYRADARKTIKVNREKTKIETIMGEGFIFIAWFKEKE